MNKLLEFLAEAIDVVRNNPMRSLLTTLGLIIGVGSVIAILAVGDSTDRSVQNLLSPYSQSSAFIVPREQQPDPQNAAIRYEDARKVKALVPDAVDVQPILAIAMETRVRHVDITLQVFTTGAGAGFDNTPLAEGRRFSDDDIAAHHRVCILSDQARTKLFGEGVPAVGRAVRLNGSYYTVVGVQQKPQTSGLLQTNSGQVTVYVPYTLIPELGYSFVFGLSIITPGPTDVTRLGNAAIAALQKIHGSRAEYEERDIKTIDDGINKTFAILTGVIGVVAGISLVVGGVGIMNIMLVSVTERTREIGIRKAIGATRSDILGQFLTEAVLLCAIGGTIGLVMGVLLAELVIHTLIVQLTGTVVSFSWFPIIAVALGFSVGVGLIFGTYPAIRASYLNPIECLR
ncbi:MAG TPA: ABC transporter permease, partial [Candidatus Eremiobacteraceae bacterium]|nr:ABC transporter permease [Candidatus Eremiobacteraceae bacterium]